MKQKIGCQAITFGNVDTREKMLKMMRDVKACGYDGIEIGLGSVEMIENADLEEIGLEIAACHAFIDIRGRDYRKAVEEQRRFVEKAKTLGVKFVFISAAFYPNKGEENYREECEMFNLFGQLCSEYDLIFCFHNHHWEFKKKALGFNIFFEVTDPRYVSLVPDVGWVTRADVDPVEFIRLHRDRIKALHFKEFTFDDRFTELGKGIVEFDRIYKEVRGNGMWIIAEQDTCDGDPVDSVRQNAEYLKKLIVENEA